MLRIRAPPRAVHSGGVVGGPRAGPVRVAPDHVPRADAEPRDDLADAVQVAAAQRRAREAAVERAEPGGVERGDRGGVAGAERRGAHRAARAGRRRRARPRRARRRPRRRRGTRVLAALRERAHPRVHRREHRLVVVGRGAGLGQAHDPAGHRARREPLERRDGRVQVGVVAVDRVDVLAQPEARVGDAHARGRGVAGERRGERAGLGRLEVLLEPEEAGRLGLQPPVDPARDEPVVVVAGDHRRARRPGRAPRRGRAYTGAASSAMSRLGRSRSSTPSPRITSRSAPRDRLEQRRAQLRPAQRGPCAAPSRGAGRRRRSSAPASRVAADAAAGRGPRRRLLARARGPVRDDAARRPRRRRGQGRAPGRRRRHARLGPAVARRGRRPTT